MYTPLLLIFLLATVSSAPSSSHRIPEECVEEIQRKLAHHLTISKNKAHDPDAILKSIMSQIDISKCENVEVILEIDNYHEQRQNNDTEKSKKTQKQKKQHQNVEQEDIMFTSEREQNKSQINNTRPREKKHNMKQRKRFRIDKRKYRPSNVSTTDINRDYDNGDFNNNSDESKNYSNEIEKVNTSSNHMNNARRYVKQLHEIRHRHYHEPRQKYHSQNRKISNTFNETNIDYPDSKIEGSHLTNDNNRNVEGEYDKNYYDNNSNTPNNGHSDMQRHFTRNMKNTKRQNIDQTDKYYNNDDYDKIKPAIEETFTMKKTENISDDYEASRKNVTSDEQNIKSLLTENFYSDKKQTKQTSFDTRDENKDSELYERKTKSKYVDQKRRKKNFDEKNYKYSKKNKTEDDEFNTDGEEQTTVINLDSTDESNDVDYFNTNNYNRDLYRHKIKKHTERYTNTAEPRKQTNNKNIDSIDENENVYYYDSSEDQTYNEYTYPEFSTSRTNSLGADNTTTTEYYKTHTEVVESTKNNNNAFKKRSHRKRKQKILDVKNIGNKSRHTDYKEQTTEKILYIYDYQDFNDHKGSEDQTNKDNTPDYLNSGTTTTESIYIYDKAYVNLETNTEKVKTTETDDKTFKDKRKIIKNTPDYIKGAKNDESESKDFDSNKINNNKWRSYRHRNYQKHDKYSKKKKGVDNLYDDNKEHTTHNNVGSRDENENMYDSNRTVDQTQEENTSYYPETTTTTIDSIGTADTTIENYASNEEIVNNSANDNKAFVTTEKPTINTPNEEQNNENKNQLNREKQTTEKNIVPIYKRIDVTDHEKNLDKINKGNAFNYHNLSSSTTEGIETDNETSEDHKTNSEEVNKTKTTNETSKEKPARNVPEHLNYSMKNKGVHKHLYTNGREQTTKKNLDSTNENEDVYYYKESEAKNKENLSYYSSSITLTTESIHSDNKTMASYETYAETDEKSETNKAFTEKEKLTTNRPTHKKEVKKAKSGKKKRNKNKRRSHRRKDQNSNKIPNKNIRKDRNSKQTEKNLNGKNEKEDVYYYKEMEDQVYKKTAAYHSHRYSRTTTTESIDKEDATTENYRTYTEAANKIEDQNRDIATKDEPATNNYHFQKPDEKFNKKSVNQVNSEKDNSLNNTTTENTGISDDTNLNNTKGMQVNSYTEKFQTMDTDNHDDLKQNEKKKGAVENDVPEKQIVLSKTPIDKSNSTDPKVTNKPKLQDNLDNKEDKDQNYDKNKNIDNQISNSKHVTSIPSNSQFTNNSNPKQSDDVTGQAILLEIYEVVKEFIMSLLKMLSIFTGGG